MNTLITIPFSPYNEKARWALDRFGVPYRERGYMPALHFPAVMIATRFGRHGRSDRGSTRFSTPLFVTSEGERLVDSCDIVRWVDQHYADEHNTLYPNDEAAQLERELGETLGVDARCIAYGLAVGDGGDRLVWMARHNTGPVQTAIVRMMGGTILKMIKRSLRIDADRVERAIVRVESRFAEIGARLEGRRYLLGDTLTAADLAFASMASTVLLPTRAEGFGAELPPLEAMEGPATDLARRLRATPAGQWAMRMFAEQRRARA